MLGRGHLNRCVVVSMASDASFDATIKLVTEYYSSTLIINLNEKPLKFRVHSDSRLQ